MVVGGILYNIIEWASRKRIEQYSEGGKSVGSTGDTTHDTISTSSKEPKASSPNIGPGAQMQEQEHARVVDTGGDHSLPPKDGVQLSNTQRSAGVSAMPPPPPPRSPPRLTPPAFGPRPSPPRLSNSAPLRPPPSTASSLRVPQTKALPNASMAPSPLMPPPPKPSRRAILQPGYSPLDWAMLTSSPNHKLRGKDVPDNLIRVPPSQLKYHNGRKGRDAWTVYRGKVYNITPYLPFHPGGEGELMRGAAKDAERLFTEVHPWVNWDGILGECLVGILVSEGDEKTPPSNSGGLDDMD